MGVECRYELAQAAYVKLALHALKHPAAAVNGLLVGRLADPAASPAVVSVVDAVPLSHQPHHLPLLPTLELALTLVEDHFQAQGLAVVGYYHANARRDDADLPAVAKRVGDHIFRYFPRAAVLLVGAVIFFPSSCAVRRGGDLAWMLIRVLLSDFVLVRSAGQREARGGGEGEQSRCRCSGTRPMIYGISIHSLLSN